MKKKLDYCNRKLYHNFFLILMVLALCVSCTSGAQTIDDPRFISHVVDLKTQTLKLYWKDSTNTNYGSIEKLKKHLKTNSKTLRFAMNGGMYLKDSSPQGLYIEKGIVKTAIDTTKEAYGNFYLQPNGIFCITKDNKGVVVETSAFKSTSNIRYATQSGPMLVINGALHSKFVKGSNNLHIRNGVGILPNGNLLFAMSKDLINLYDFADFFKSVGCKNALYLDGFVSRTYLPEKNWEQLDGNFGVIIAEIKE
ncbi:phosphodiester glycosidase family protein [uncultured Psychroserpens sp.]|uniref:phosphodiester glycosidase family protein n=1 Tax=uncultured Psychroserpens sp. TaxID=255436 RepID=UPI0026368B84|nr:phosphodiester glycosidase family protein [uncultured Psychroserpens sp.]